MKAKWFWARAGSFAVGAAVVVGLLFGGVMAASVQTGAAGAGASALQASTGAAGQVPVQTLAQAGKGVQPTPSSGPREGIKVHGHWIIEVRNRDGSLAARREFDNLFQGQNTLASVLAREKTVGLWRVNIGGTNAQPCQRLGLRAVCRLVEPSDWVPRPSDSVYEHFTSLSVRSDGLRLVLAGTATVSYDADIGYVDASHNPCAPNVAPRDCLPGGIDLSDWPWSIRELEKTIHVVPGQIIQVTVIYSFS